MSSRRPALRGTEAQVETLVRHLLGDPQPPEPALLAGYAAPPAHWRAPRGYRPVLPVPMWPDLRGLSQPPGEQVASLPTDGTPEEGGDGTARKTRRMKSDQAERKDSIILYKFEAMLTWAEMININRRVEDDDLDNARKAADDHEEIVLGQVSKTPATKLKLHLDLAPEDVDRERIAGRFTYPEWDARGGVWLPDHCRVLAAPVEPVPDYAGVTDPAARRRIEAVRRQFQALRPARAIRHAQPDGDELDLDAALRSVADLRATLAETRADLAGRQNALDRTLREAQGRRQRLAAIEAERRGWTGRSEGADERLAELMERAETAKAELEELAGRPDEIEAERADLATRIADAERVRKRAADTLNEAEATLAATEKRLKQAETGLGDAREARVRAEAAVASARQTLEAVRERASDAEFAGAVTLTGHADYFAAAGLYRRGDVFVSPTYSEGFSNTILEAMASGLPIVSTNAVGVVDCLTDGSNALLVEPREVDGLAQAIARIIDDTPLRQRLAHQSLEEVRSLYSWHAIGRRIQEIYRDLQGTKPDTRWTALYDPAEATRETADLSCRFRAAPHLL